MLKCISFLPSLNHYHVNVITLVSLSIYFTVSANSMKLKL